MKNHEIFDHAGNAWTYLFTYNQKSMLHHVKELSDQTNNHLFNNSDASGNPVTQQVQSVAVTDASGNPVTGMVSNISKF